MAKRLLNSEKNARARAAYVAKLAKANQANMDAVNKEIDRQETAWQDAPPGPGNDIVTGPREAPTRIFRPKKGGGGTFFDGAGNEVKAKDDAEERDVANLLRAGGGVGAAQTGATGDDEKPKGESLEQAVKGAQDGIADAAASGDGWKVANSYVEGGGRLLASAAPFLTEDMGETEAPQNLGQWLVNLLSTGTYVTARAGEGIGAAAAANAKRHEAGDLDVTGMRTAGEAAVNAIGGAVRGVGEGLGMRFDGERPRTWGQNFEALGSKDALEGALGEEGGKFAQGTLGFAGDVALDPLSWVTLGLTGVGRGALQGAKEGAQAASTTAGSVARGAAGAVKGGLAGAAARRAKIALERAEASEARHVKRAEARGEDIAGTNLAGEPQLALEMLPAVDDIVGAGEEAQRLFVGTERGEVFQPDQLDLRNPQLALPAKPSDYRPRAASVEQVQQGARLLDPVLRATDELTPSLRGTVAAPKLDLGGLLSRGSRAVTTKVPLIDSQGSAAMSSAISNVRNAVQTGADVERAIAGAMSQLERVPSVAARMDTIADNQGATVRDLLEAAMRGNTKATDQVAKLWRRQVDETAQVVNTPALRAAIDAAEPGLREGLGIEKAKLHRLVSNLNRTADPTAQQAILNRVLGKSYQRGYGGFRDALAGVARGELAPEQMTQMLSALGVKTRATTPATLRELLRTKGVAAYDEAVAKIPTPEQVRQTFNLTDDDVVAMQAIDPEQMLDAAAGAADQVAAAAGVPELAGIEFPATDVNMPAPKPPKPPVTPQRRPAEFTGHDFDASGPGRNSNPNPVGKAAYSGVQTLGRLLRETTEEGKRGNTLTSYTDEVSTAVHRAVVAQLKMPYLKKGGGERAERFLPRWLEAMNVVDAWARGKGMFPHLVDNENGTGAIWVSPSQVLELLDGELVGAAMFAPIKTRGSRAAEEAIGYVNGMTVYPNHVMSGLKVALSGGTPEQVAKIITDRAVGASKGMQRGTDRYVKAFAEKPEGRKAIAELSAAMTEPGFLDAVRTIDARTKPIAEAISQRYIDNIVARAGERLIATLKDGGDRGTLMRVLDDVAEWADDAARPALLDADRISATVRERLDSAIVKGILGETGFLTAQHDWAFVNALEVPSAAQLADAQAGALAREQARLSSYRAAAPGARDDLRPAAELTAERGRVATAAEPFVDDALARAIDEVEQATGTRYADAPEELFGEMDARVSHSLLERLAATFSGKFGQADLWAGRTSAEEGTLAQAAHYTDRMMRWIDTVATRLSAERGVKVKPQEALDHLNGPVFRALAATDPENWGNTGKIYTELRTGRSFPDVDRAALADAGVFAALDDFDARLGVEMMKFIDHVFNPNRGGLLGRSGLAAEDLVDASKWHLRGDFAAFKLDPSEPLAEQAQKWRAWGVADSPLDIIDRTHRALQAALVPQQIGHSLAPLFGHRALMPGVPTKELYAQGWRKIDTGEARGIGRFAAPDAYFPPHILEQLRYVDEFLAASRGFDPDSGFGRFVVRPYDAVTHTLKSMNTIWRPGHHVTNVLGEFGMLIMAGVNPLQAGRAIHTIRAGGGAVDADMSALDDVVRKAIDPDGKAPDPKFADETVNIVLRDGRGGHKIERIPLKTVWEWAVNSGVALTHTAARDLMGDLSTGVARDFWNSNPLAKGDQALGKFSATRDNVTRIAHFIDALEKGVFANVDQARAAAQTKVHDYHPTVRTLSRFEQKYARRLVFFYTWVRQAISRVIRTALDQPGYVTMPFKAQYNMAEANGLNPESIGGPTTDDPRTASYTDNSLLGPTFADAGADGEPGDLWAWSLSSPQIDTLQALFGTFNQRPSTGNPVDDLVNNVAAPAWELAGDVANPALTIPGETVAGLTGQGGGKGFTQIASESAGLPTALARSLPAGLLSGDTDSGSVYSQLFPNSSGAKKSPEEQKSEMGRYLLNLVTGLKFQNTTTGTSEKRAKEELHEEVKRVLAAQGIDDPDTITEVRDAVWAQRVATQTRG